MSFSDIDARSSRPALLDVMGTLRRAFVAGGSHPRRVGDRHPHPAILPSAAARPYRCGGGNRPGGRKLGRKRRRLREPYLLGWAKDLTGSTGLGVLVLASALLIGAALVFAIPARLVND